MTNFEEMARKAVFRHHAKRLLMSTDIDEFLAEDDDNNGLDKEVASVSTGKAVEPPHQPARRQIRAASVVKAIAPTPAEEAPPTQPADKHVMDVEFEDLSGGAEPVGHGDEPTM